MNYYDVLGVSKDVSPEDLKKAYRKMANQHHPDKEGGNHETFITLQAAYETLSDPDKRAQYDMHGGVAMDVIEVAKRELASLVEHMLDQVISGGFKGQVNIIDEMRKHLRNGKYRQRAQVIELVNAANGIRKVKKRMSVSKKGDPFLIDMLMKKRELIIRNYLTLRALRVKVDVMLSLLENYSYESDPVVPHPVKTSGAWGATTTFFP